MSRVTSRSREASLRSRRTRSCSARTSTAGSPRPCAYCLRSTTGSESNAFTCSQTEASLLGAQMLSVFPLGPDAIGDELGLPPRPRLGIDERRHPDRNPFGVGALRAALAIARATIFQPTQPIRPPEIPRLRAIVVGFPFVDGVP